MRNKVSLLVYAKWSARIFYREIISAEAKTMPSIWTLCLCIMAANMKQVMMFSGEYSNVNGIQRYVCYNAILSNLEACFNCENYYSGCNKNDIYFMNSSFPILSPGIHRIYESITSLTMKHSNISVILPGFLNNFPELKMLDFANNNISYLTAGIFNSLSELKILDMSSNIIRNISDQTFFGLNNLRSLDLSNNHITSLISIFYDHQANLESQNSLFFVMPNIEVVDVSHNELSELASPGPTVLHLDLSYNNITTIPVSVFSNARSLKILCLHHNYIQHLPRNVFKNLSSLESLDISFNNLNETQYGQLDHLEQLKYLNLSNNHLNLEFHKLISLIHLEELQLANNTFSNFEPVSLLNHFPKLQVISLYNHFWDCKKLATTNSYFRSKNVMVVPGTDYSDEYHNIIGIPCHDYSTFEDKIDTLPYNSSTLEILYRDIGGYLRRNNLYLGDISAKIDKIQSNHVNDMSESIEKLLLEIKQTGSTDNSSQTNIYTLLQHEMELSLQKSQNRLLGQRLEHLENTLKSYFSNYSSAYNEKLTSFENKSSHSESVLVDILLFLILSILLVFCYLYFKNTFGTPKRDEVELV
ncbi:chaoptin-like [Cylas formicarius]|uniref:chaoptin-like n=1 Tax=Cylas formicarius TaxID=197179 RepID=UPI0029588B0A|nr:chaoptin-like [Cylas formicarius]